MQLKNKLIDAGYTLLFMGALFAVIMLVAYIGFPEVYKILTS